MDNIKLTEEHKKKLIEMCNKLFPNDFFSFYLDELEIRWRDENDLYKNSTIHWFEFCMTYLVGKISFTLHFMNGEPSHDRDGRIDTWYTVWSILNSGHGMKQHPIDYLYEQFKKI